VSPAQFAGAPARPALDQLRPAAPAQRPHGALRGAGINATPSAGFRPAVHPRYDAPRTLPAAPRTNPGFERMTPRPAPPAYSMPREQRRERVEPRVSSPAPANFQNRPVMAPHPQQRLNRGAAPQNWQRSAPAQPYQQRMQRAQPPHQPRAHPERQREQRARDQ
jgi:hypothetical protein